MILVSSFGHDIIVHQHSGRPCLTPSTDSVAVEGRVDAFDRFRHSGTEVSDKEHPICYFHNNSTTTCRGPVLRCSVVKKILEKAAWCGLSLSMFLSLLFYMFLSLLFYGNVFGEALLVPPDTITFTPCLWRCLVRTADFRFSACTVSTCSAHRNTPCLVH